MELQTTTDNEDRRQRPLLVCPYTMCRRASNKVRTRRPTQVKKAGDRTEWCDYFMLNNLPGNRDAAELRSVFEPETCRSQIRCGTRYATMPPWAIPLLCGGRAGTYVRTGKN